jgi:uncharacterized protein YcbX
MPIVARLSIAPVKSLALLHLDEILLTEHGVAEDRRFYLVDQGGRLIDGLVVGALVQVHAWTDPQGSRLRLTLPDGRVIDDEIRTGEPIATAIYGRTAMSHVVLGPWTEALSALYGRPLRLARVDRPGGTRRYNQASIVGDGSLARLGYQFGLGAVDGRRFRMLIELADASEHEEDGWIGRRVAIGKAILHVTKPDARCAMTTHDPDSGARDLDTLRAIREYRGLRDGKKLDFGVLADVERAGRVRLGDEVRLVD